MDVTKLTRSMAGCSTWLDLTTAGCTRIGVKSYPRPKTKLQLCKQERGCSNKGSGKPDGPVWPHHVLLDSCGTFLSAAPATSLSPCRSFFHLACNNSLATMGRTFRGSCQVDMHTVGTLKRCVVENSYQSFGGP